MNERDGGYHLSLCCDSNRQGNLTHQYYALFGKEYITWMGLAEKWQELLSRLSDPQVLEKGVCTHFFPVVYSC